MTNNIQYAAFITTSHQKAVGDMTYSSPKNIRYFMRANNSTSADNANPVILDST